MEKEQELILKAVLIDKSEEQVREICTLLEQRLDWFFIGGVLLNHRLSGYFYNGLTKRQQEKLPGELRANLKLIVEAQKEKQKRLIPELKEVNQILTESGIRFAALKGAVFGACLYHMGDRRSNDIDLLVFEEDLDKLDTELRKAGFIQTNMSDGPIQEATKREKLIQRMNYHDLVPYLRKLDDDYLALDINFLFDGKENLIDREIHEYGTRLYQGEDYEILGLPVETNLAFLCAHFYREASNTIWTSGKRDVLLYKIVDIMNFIRKFRGEIAVPEWTALMRKLKLDQKCYLTFHALSEFYSDPFIDSVLAELDVPDDAFLKQIYDPQQKCNIERNGTFREAAFDGIS